MRVLISLLLSADWNPHCLPLSFSCQMVILVSRIIKQGKGCNNILELDCYCPASREWGRVLFAKFSGT